MEKYLSFLENLLLFQSMEKEEILKLIDFLDGHIKVYEKTEMIYNFLDNIDYAGIVLEGEVEVTMLNFSGNQYGVMRFPKGGFFGAAYACLPKEHSLVRINAHQKTAVLFLKLRNLESQEVSNISGGYTFSLNLLKETARKNIYQNKKIQILIQNKIRDKLIVFLHGIKVKNGVIVLPFNRQALANHLGVDRSALSREMSKMKEEGYIDFYKNKIYIKKEHLFDAYDESSS